jgi:Ala-tRNA(Pro) deacylase
MPAAAPATPAAESPATTHLTPDELCTYLTRKGLPFHRVDHKAVFTVGESTGLHQELPGLHSKNLFLKDKKGRLFLVSARDTARIDLKRLHEVIGASGRLSFGSSELLQEKLGVTPGSVTAFAVINDRAGEVTMVLDANLMTGEDVNFHPLINTATLRIARDDMLAFLRGVDHEPMIVDLPVPADGQNG